MSEPACMVIVKGLLVFIDVLDPATGKGRYSGKSLEEIQKETPQAELAELGPWLEAKEQALCTKPIEITEDHFFEALDVLPPQNWQRGRNCESFELCEHTSGRVTAIYCRFGRRFFMFQGLAGQSLAKHAEYCGMKKEDVCNTR